MDSVSNFEALSTPLTQSDGVQVNFCPDLIVEVTSICDRACSGCYANNIISKKSKTEVYEKFQNMFINTSVLSTRINEIADTLSTISFRGGEPTRHPFLARIIETTYEATDAQIYVETHGRWILDEPDAELLHSLKDSNGIIKLSFDSMHELTPGSLKKITDHLDSEGVSYLVAITEDDFEKFSETRAECPWLMDSQFIFQKKTKKMSELPQPPVGVISCGGNLTRSLNVRAGFKTL